MGTDFPSEDVFAHRGKQKHPFTRGAGNSFNPGHVEISALFRV